MKFKQSQKKNINYGIQILRVILSMMVVFDHFYDRKAKKRFIYILWSHIPTFFLLSFYYTYNTFTSFNNIQKIKLRLERLLIPYLGWNLIWWILFNIYFYAFKEQRPHSFYSLLENILSGRIFFQAMWFQNILILLTLLIAFIIVLFKRSYYLIFQIIIIISYSAQYSGKNYDFFYSHFDSKYYMTYGRIAEAFPNALSGFLLCYINIYEKAKRNIKNVIFLCLLTFRYGGIRKNIIAICFFINKYLEISTRYNLGIYFLHCPIGRSKIMKKIFNKKLHTIFGCLSIYFNSYMICLILDKYIGKTKLKHMIK